MAGKNAKRVLRISKETQPYRTELTPVSFLRRSAYVFADKIAVVHGDRRYTYRQFEERANRLASGLRAAGLRHLDRVAFICPNTPAMLEAHFGVPAAGLVLVPINTRLNTDEIGYILKHSGAKFVFVDHELDGLVKPLDLTGARVVRVDDTGAPGDPYEDFLAAGSPEPCEPWLEDENETISINYTSGTTGRPKGVMVTHRALRPPGRARRVVDRDRLVLVLEPRLTRLGRARGQEILVRIAGRAGVVHAHHARAREVQRLDEPVKLVIDEDELRARVLEDVADLVGVQPRVDRH